MEGRSFATQSDSRAPFFCGILKGEKIGDMDFGKGGLLDKIIWHAFTDSRALITHIAGQILTQSICLKHLDILLTPCVESHSTETDNPLQSLSFDVAPLAHKIQMHYAYMCKHARTHTHTHTLGREDLLSQHATIF